MRLPETAVRRPVTTFMFTLIAVLIGIVSLSRIPLDLLPRLEVPVGIVSVIYRGTGPVEMEKLVTRPVEEALSTVSNIKEIRSVTSAERSVVIAEFNFGTDMDFAAIEMREKTDMIKGFLPPDAENPVVMKIDPDALPILNAALYGESSLFELQNFAESEIKPRLERLEGVASVSISGGHEQQVEVLIKEEAARGYGMTVDYVANVLRAENTNIPVGEVSKGSTHIAVKTLGEFKELGQIRNLPIPLRTGGVVALGEIADVNLKMKDTHSIAKINGNSTIDISVRKVSGRNTVAVADTIREELSRIENQYQGRTIDIVLDQSEYIRLSIGNVVENAAVGALLAIIILYLFFRSLGSTLILGTAIPVSIIAAFTLIYFNGITLNMMTLGGLALGVGMLVDNSIVVLENIYRLRQEGETVRNSAVKGASEVGLAVTASTFTTIAVFLPIVFVEGVTATLFRELALTVTLSLLASLAVSLTLIPMLASRIMKTDKKGKREKRRFFSGLYTAFDSFFTGVVERYRSLLGWSLRHRAYTVSAGLVIFGISLILSILFIGAEYFPQMDEGQFTVSISLPDGAELEDTSETAQRIEGMLGEIVEVETVYTNIGGAGNMFMDDGRASRAIIDVVLAPVQERKRSTAQVADEVRASMAEIPGIDAEVSVNSYMMQGLGGDAVSIIIKGKDLEVLKAVGYDIRGAVESIEGTREVRTDLEEGVPEAHITIDRGIASRYGLTAAAIAGAVKGFLKGTAATRYRYGGEEIDVIVRGDHIYSESIPMMEQLPVSLPEGKYIPLGQVAKVNTANSPVSIRREGQSRVVKVTGDVLGRDLAAVTADVKEVLRSYSMPQGYSYEIGGQDRELKEAFSDLLLALLLAIALVYMILASQFESLLYPFVIMLSVPLSFSGGVYALYITGRTLSVPSFIGAIILAGIVVNDAIVLIDYINTRRKRGEGRAEAILNAGPVRLRPILITTLTTVLGLLPLALGISEGAEILAPLATVVIGGLTLATLLTLVFIPVLYTVFDDLAQAQGRKTRSQGSTGGA